MNATALLRAILSDCGIAAPESDEDLATEPSQVAALKAIRDAVRRLYVSIGDSAHRKADAPTVIAWIRDPNRKAAFQAFSEGPERQIALAVEAMFGASGDGSVGQTARDFSDTKTKEI